MRFRQTQKFPQTQKSPKNFRPFFCSLLLAETPPRTTCRYRLLIPRLTTSLLASVSAFTLPVKRSDPGVLRAVTHPDLACLRLPFDKSRETGPSRKARAQKNVSTVSVFNRETRHYPGGRCCFRPYRPMTIRTSGRQPHSDSRHGRMTNKPVANRLRTAKIAEKGHAATRQSDPYGLNQPDFRFCRRSPNGSSEYPL